MMRREEGRLGIVTACLEGGKPEVWTALMRKGDGEAEDKEEI